MGAPEDAACSLSVEGSNTVGDGCVAWLVLVGFGLTTVASCLKLCAILCGKRKRACAPHSILWHTMPRRGGQHPLNICETSAPLPPHTHTTHTPRPSHMLECAPRVCVHKLDHEQTWQSTYTYKGSEYYRKQTITIAKFWNSTRRRLNARTLTAHTAHTAHILY